MSERRPRESSGFTLLELLVVITIIGIVMAIGTSTFYGVMAAWNERRTVAELDAQADAVLESIRRDIADTLAYDVAAVPIHGDTATIEDTRTYPHAQHPDDTLLVPIRAVDPNRPLAVPANVGYRVERAADGGILMRTVGPLGGGFPTTNRSERMPPARVLGFSVEYLSTEPGALWTDAWSRGEMPAAIRVSLAIEDVDRPDQFQVARQMVFPVHVR